MEGEAFFEVTPDASSPFVVYSGDLVTRVVGTSFNIKAYRDGTTDEVSVFTGTVSVSLPNRDAGSETGELYLVKAEKAVFGGGKNQLSTQNYIPGIHTKRNRVGKGKRGDERMNTRRGSN